MKPAILRPIRPHKCHCGNLSENGLGRPTPPSEKSKRLCCLLCSCQEDGAYQRYIEEDAVQVAKLHLGRYALPGCGPMCIYHPESVRQERIEELQQRAFKQNRES